MSALSIDTVLGWVTSLVTTTVSWVGSYLSMITDNVVLQIFCIALPLVGLGIGVIKRITGIRM